MSLVFEGFLTFQRRLDVAEMREDSEIFISSYPEGETYGVNHVFYTGECCI
jgi:hypothetical protein